MRSDDNSVTPLTVITVTYGERWSLVDETIASVLETRGVRVIVFANGASHESIVGLRNLADAYPERVEIIESSRNLGSAPAFSAALEVAYKRGDAILILDDDNPVAPGTIERLSQISRELENSGRVRTALVAYRPRNSTQRAILAGEDPDWVFRELIPGAFHGFDTFALLRNRMRLGPRKLGLVRNNTQLTIDGDQIDLKALPVAMWGGIYLPASVVALQPMHHPELVLYTDDNDFSRALRNAGVDILISDDVSIVDAIEWRPTETTERRRSRWIPSTFKVPNSDIWRLQYLHRNQAYLSRQQVKGRPIAHLRLTLNVAVRMGAFITLGLIVGRPKLVFAVTGATSQGLRGKLGETYPLPQAS